MTTTNSFISISSDATTEIVVQFVALNLLFVGIVKATKIEEKVSSDQLGWMDSFYIAVQTTTTIGKPCMHAFS